MHLVSGTESQRFRTGWESVDVATMSFTGPKLSGAHISIWNVDTGRCCETIEGYGDADAIAASLNRLRVVVRGSEVAVHDPGSGRDVAWFPLAPRIIKMSPASLVWAASNGAQLRLLRLER